MEFLFIQTWMIFLAITFNLTNNAIINEVLIKFPLSFLWFDSFYRIS